MTSTNKIKQIWFEGNRYYESRGYFETRQHNLLHRDIWKFFNQHDDIDGFHIHHKDGNKFNNSLSNLEKISPRDHALEHWKNKPTTLQSCKECGVVFENTHKREECSNNCYQKRKRKEYRFAALRQCLMCGTDFKTDKYQPATYCSYSCSSKTRIRGENNEFKRQSTTH